MRVTLEETKEESPERGGVRNDILPSSNPWRTLQTPENWIFINNLDTLMIFDALKHLTKQTTLSSSPMPSPTARNCRTMTTARCLRPSETTNGPVALGGVAVRSLTVRSLCVRKDRNLQLGHAGVQVIPSLEHNSGISKYFRLVWGQRFVGGAMGIRSTRWGQAPLTEDSAVEARTRHGHSQTNLKHVA